MRLALPRPRPRRPLSVALAAFAALSALAPAAARAAGPLEAETLAPSPSSAGGVISDGTASAGRALKLWSNATAGGTVTLAEAGATLAVRARGQQCAGAPMMYVSVDGIRLLSTAVAATSYATAVTNLPIGPGAHRVAVTFANDFRTATCDRNLIVDTIALTAATPTLAPPPPAALP